MPFALLGYLARVLGTPDLGKIGVFLLLVNLAGVVVGLNTHGLVSVAYFRDGAGRGAAVAMNACFIVMAISVTTLLVAFALGGSALAARLQIPPLALLACVLCAAAQFVLQVLLAYLQSTGQPIQYGTLTVVASAGTVLFTLATLATEPSWLARVWGQLIAGFLTATCALWVVARTLALQTSFDRRAISRAIKFGLPLVPHSLAVTVMSGYDRLYVAQQISASAAGEYFAAAQVAAILTLGAAAINQAFAPWMYRKLATGIRADQVEVVKVSRRLVCLALALAAAMALSARPLISLVFGAGYEGSAVLLVYLAPSVAIGSIYFIVSNFLFYTERTGALPVATFAATLVQVLLIHTLGVRHGTTGVALAVLASQCVFVAGVWWLAQKSLPMPWWSFRE